MDAYQNNSILGHQQQFWLNYQHLLMQLHRRCRMNEILLLRERYAMCILDIIEANHWWTHNDPRLEWYNMQHSQRKLDWFVSEPGPGGRLGGYDDLLRDFPGGLVPWNGSDELLEPWAGRDIPRTGPDVLPGGDIPLVGEEVPRHESGAGGGDFGVQNPFDLDLGA